MTVAINFDELINTLGDFNITLRDTSGAFRGLSKLLDDITSMSHKTYRASESRRLADAAMGIINVYRYNLMDEIFEQDDESALNTFLQEFHINDRKEMR